MRWFWLHSAFFYHDKTEKFSRNETYEGMNALFEVSLDPETADPEATEK